MTPHFQKPEFHRPLAIETIGPVGLERDVVADAGECADLATRLQLPRVFAASCRFQLSREGHDGEVVVAVGRLLARVELVCVVSLDLFEAAVDESFQIRFVPDGTQDDGADPDSDDELPYSGAAIDLGEAASEQLALSLDPYPRKPGAALPEAEPATAVVHPFAALAARGTRDN